MTDSSSSPVLQGQSMAAGQTPCQRYWPKLLKMIEDGTVRYSKS